MWLMLTDPHVLMLKPGTLMVKILDRDNDQIGNCWRCIAIVAMSEAMHGYLREALGDFQKAMDIVRRDTGSVPTRLTASIDTAAAQAAKQNR